MSSLSLHYLHICVHMEYNSAVVLHPTNVITSQNDSMNVGFFLNVWLWTFIGMEFYYVVFLVSRCLGAMGRSHTHVLFKNFTPHAPGSASQSRPFTGQQKDEPGAIRNRLFVPWSPQPEDTQGHLLLIELGPHPTVLPV